MLKKKLEQRLTSLIKLAKVALTLVLLIVFTTNLAAAEKRVKPILMQAATVTDFVTHIRVNEDASLTITNEVEIDTREKDLTIYSIFGVYKDFEFDFLELKLDGKDSKTSINYNKRKIKFTNLKPGKHTYTQKFWVKRAVTMFTEYDLLMWRAIYFKDIDVKKGKVIVELPMGAEASSFYVKTLHAQYKVWAEKNKVIFDMLSPLGASEAFGVEVSWDKGFVTLPLVKEHQDSLVELTSEDFSWMVIFFVFSYYLYIWFQIDNIQITKRDSYPRPYPPRNFSYMAVAVFLGKDNWHHLFPLTLLSLVFKKIILIRECNNTLILELLKTPAGKDISYSEYTVVTKLFNKDEKTFVVDKKNSKKLITVIKSLKKDAKYDFINSCLWYTFKYFIIGGIISIVGFMLVAILPNKFLRTDIVFPATLLTINFVAYLLLRKELLKLDKIKERIEGFKSYLQGNTAYIRGKLPNLNKGLYEEYLPYSLLFSCCEDWTQNFFEANEGMKYTYNVDWYEGDLFNNFQTDTYVYLVNTINLKIESCISEDNN